MGERWSLRGVERLGERRGFGRGMDGTRGYIYSAGKHGMLNRSTDGIRSTDGSQAVAGVSEGS